MTYQDKNAERIREFLSRSPVIRVGIGISGVPPHLLDPSIPVPEERIAFDPRNVKVTTESEVIHDERDTPSRLPSGSHHGVSISGLNEDSLTPELQEKITEYLVERLSPMLGRNLDEPTLRQPIDIISAFFEGLKVARVVTDYSVCFDLERSSHRARSIAYTISIQPTDAQLWKKLSDKFWDHFTAIITDTRSPTLFPELVARWAKAVADLLGHL